ncbi:hypothetical protein [Candidatus Poriferisodalis sp.]|uniref:hypothetical protein n=1 Tax=Candidatus Poriferisodalis sp. TaxID=3101277 RepID=UPI003D13BC6B
MSMAPQFGYPTEEQQPVARHVARPGVEPWRLAAAGAIVGVVVLAVWLWGRPDAEPPRALVAVTAEAWIAGQPPGSFEVVNVSAELATRLVEPDAIADRVVAHDVPAGTFVSPALLTSAERVTGAMTAMRFGVDASAWPSPGPRAGSNAVVSTVKGGCAIGVTTLLDGDDDSIVIRVDADEAARLAAAAQSDGLVVWPAPPDGWPECRKRVGAVGFPSPFAAEAETSLPVHSSAGAG